MFRMVRYAAWSDSWPLNHQQHHQMIYSATVVVQSLTQVAYHPNEQSKVRLVNKYTLTKHAYFTFNKISNLVCFFSQLGWHLKVVKYYSLRWSSICGLLNEDTKISLGKRMQRFMENIFFVKDKVPGLKSWLGLSLVNCYRLYSSTFTEHCSVAPPFFFFLPHRRRR